MAIAGRVAIVPQGEFDISATYKRLDMVFYDGNGYVAKKEATGKLPTDEEFWMQSTEGAVTKVATTEQAGIVKPDGVTITVTEDGTITGASTEFVGTMADYEAAVAAGEIKDGTIVNITDDYQVGGSNEVEIATTEKPGIVKPDGTSITVDEEGTISVTTSITIDDALSDVSENPVQNKVITSSLAEKIGTIYLPINSNLNDVITPGFYYNNQNNKVETFSNCPTESAFFMLVAQHAGKYQEITEYHPNNPKKWFRNMYGGSWGDWYRIYTGADNVLTKISEFSANGSGDYDIIPSVPIDRFRALSFTIYDVHKENKPIADQTTIYNPDVSSSTDYMNIYFKDKTGSSSSTVATIKIKNGKFSCSGSSYFKVVVHGLYPI